MDTVMIYLFLMVIFWLIGVAVLRWMLRINKIVQELELLRKALMAAHNLEPVYNISDEEVIKEAEKISKSGIDQGRKALKK